jgi:tetratricopeptide (TPR) repeat protein
VPLRHVALCCHYISTGWGPCARLTGRTAFGRGRQKSEYSAQEETADEDPALDSRKYLAFLSYSHRDAKWGSWLHKALESYHPPKQIVGKVTPLGTVPKRLVPIFRDREELATATDLGAVINEALTGSGCQIVICSPSAARSRWVNEEILAFKRLGREDRIFCLIVGGEPNASDDPAHADEECFPPALRYRLAADGSLSSIRTEPIAADARPGKDGRGNAKLKLIAGILGVGFDALRQREQSRRQRQLFAIASGAVAGMVLTSGLATVALIARATAQRQTVIARREAETARQTTAFLVDLFRISDPSEARGNSLTAREVLDTGAERVDRQLTEQPQIQATLMDTLGTVYMGLGLYQPAQQLLGHATEKRRALPAEERGDLALSLQHVGDLKTLRAEYPAAESSYQQAIAIQRSLPHGQRDDAALAKSLFGLGQELIERGDHPAAERQLREALALQQRLYPGPHEDTARTLQKLAWAVDQRDLNEALPLAERAVAMHRALWGPQPYPDFAAAMNDLGLMLYDKGDYDRAVVLLQDSMAMNRALLGDKHPEIAVSLNNIANVLHDKGDLAGAETAYRQSLAMRRELLGNEHPLVAQTLNNLAFVYYDRGNERAALDAERESLAIYRKVFPGDNPDVARIMNRLGYWQTETGDFTGAKANLDEALAMRRRLFGASHPEIASSLAHVAVFQVATGHYREAAGAAQAAEQIFTKSLSATNWKTALTQSIKGAALTGMGEYPSAELLLVHANTVMNDDPGAMPMYRALTRRYLESLYRHWGRPQEARRYAAIKIARAGAEPASTTFALPPPN